MLPKNLFRHDWVAFSSQHDLQSSVASFPPDKADKDSYEDKIRIKEECCPAVPQIGKYCQTLARNQIAYSLSWQM